MMQRGMLRLWRGAQRAPPRWMSAARALSSRRVPTSETKPLPIHFVQDEQEVAAHPFRIVGVRDVEVEDPEFPTRIEADYNKHPRPIRNRFQHRNFISLWIDDLPKLETFLKQQQVPLPSEGIVRGPDGHDVLVIPPSDDGRSIEFFNLCDNPAMVELVQAPKGVIDEFDGVGVEQVLDKTIGEDPRDDLFEVPEEEWGAQISPIKPSSTQ